MISKEQLAALSAPFPINAHTVREGFKNGGKTKIRWFTYIDVREVVKRLDEVFPGAWSTTKPEIIPLSTGIIATIGITINGETRWYSGADDFDVDFKTGEVQPSADQGKGAVTDAIRRAASLWGVAEYIYSMDLELWTDSYERNDWDKQNTLKAEALKRFTDWYNRQFSQKSAPNPFSGGKPATTPPPAQNAPKDNLSANNGTSEPAWDAQAWLAVIAICAEKGVTVKDALGVDRGSQWTKGYNAAIAAVDAYVGVDFAALPKASGNETSR